MMTQTLGFGKYKDLSIEDVYNNDPNYCRWLTKQHLPINDEVKEFLDSKFDSNDQSYVMTWGKYKNKTLKQINEIDNFYITWLKNNQYVDEKCPRLKKELINY
jgi:uncharacterized protein (DUF3820 family)